MSIASIKDHPLPEDFKRRVTIKKYSSSELSLSSDIQNLHRRLSHVPDPRRNTYADIHSFMIEDELKTPINPADVCIPYNSLAISRQDARPTCCICSDWARWVCSRCMNTFYCNKSHAYSDNVHGEMCELMAFTRTKKKNKFVMSKTSRAQLQQIRNAQTDYVMKKFKDVGTRNLCVKKYVDANIAFQQAIYFVVQSYGASSTKLCSLFVLKSRCSIGLGRYKDAFREITKAEFCFTDNPNNQDNDFMKSGIAMTQGMIHMAAEDWTSAMKSVGDALIIIAFKTGPYSIKTANLYYCMAEIFFFKKNFDESTAYFSLCLKAYVEWTVTLFQKFYVEFEYIIKDTHYNQTSLPGVLPTLTSPFHFETESIEHIKRLTHLFEKQNSHHFGQCCLFMALMSMFKGLYEESYRFAERAKYYLQSDDLMAVAKQIQTLITLYEDQLTFAPSHVDVTFNPKEVGMGYQNKIAFEKAMDKRSERIIQIYHDNGLEFDKELVQREIRTEDEKLFELLRGDPFEL